MAVSSLATVASRLFRRPFASTARQRILEMDAHAAGRVLPLLDGGSLDSEHTTAQLAGLVDAASVAELCDDFTGRRCFVLQHASEPAARLAHIWLLPKFPSGRFDGGAAGSVGVGPTLIGARTHAALPLAAAAPLVSHMLRELSGEAVEALAELPGLSSWIATHTAADLDGKFGVAAADAAMVMALDGVSITAFPTGLRLRTTARPAWEALAAEYAESAAAAEASLYRTAGAQSVGVAYVADTSEEGLRGSGGALGWLAWAQPEREEAGASVEAPARRGGGGCGRGGGYPLRT